MFAQQVFYFPIASKLKALFRLPAYKRMLQHEFFRTHNENLMSDVYDAPAWKDFMGAVVFPNNRIGNTHFNNTTSYIHILAVLTFNN